MVLIQSYIHFKLQTFIEFLYKWNVCFLHVYVEDIHLDKMNFGAKIIHISALRFWNIPTFHALYVNTSWHDVDQIVGIMGFPFIWYLFVDQHFFLEIACATKKRDQSWLSFKACSIIQSLCDCNWWALSVANNLVNNLY